MRIQDGIFRIIQIVLVGCLSVFVIGIAIFGKEGYLAREKLLDKQKTVARQMRELDQKLDSYNKEIYALEHDLGYIEKLARNELGMVKPGEIVYREARRRIKIDERAN